MTDLYEAAKAALDALVDKWRKDARGALSLGRSNARTECADELAAVIREHKATGAQEFVLKPGWLAKDMEKATSRMAPTGGAILPVEPSDEAVTKARDIYWSYETLLDDPDAVFRNALRAAYAIDSAKKEIE